MTTIKRHHTTHVLHVEDAPAIEGIGPFSGKPRAITPRRIEFSVGDGISKPRAALVGFGVKADGSPAQREYEVKVYLSEAPEWLRALVAEVTA